MDNFPYQQDAVLDEEELPAEFDMDQFMEDEIDPDVVEMPDGSAMVTMDELEGQEHGGFYENLALVMSESETSKLAIRFMYNIDADKKAREKRDEQYAEGMKRTGMGEEAPGGADFDGASKVAHPVLAEASVDFAARAMKELFPADGPVRTTTIGEASEEKTEIAERKRDYMNWQLTEQIVEFRDELQQLLTQLPLGGSQFLKLWWDAKKRRPRAQFIPIDRIYLPFTASSFYTAPRVTEVQDISDFEFRQRVEQGIYRDTDQLTSSMEPEASESETANRRIEGKEYQDSDDGIRRIYHIECYLELDDDPITKGAMAPYTMMIDDNDYSVLGLYRNWEDGDPDFEELDWIVEFKFIPWRGAYAIGFFQLIGGLAASATGSLRALLDTAHAQNSMTMLKLKGGKVGGQSKQVDIGEVVEIEAIAGIDDIRKIAMPMPYNPPSETLYKLLGWLTDAAKGVVTTAEEKIADATNNMPVGTAQALIEQGSVVFSSIHAGLHASQKRVLRILQRIDRFYLKDQKQDYMVEELKVIPSDFDIDTNVIPVSDPHIFSEGQRVAQNQAILQMMEKAPELYDARAVHSRVLKQMKVPNVSEIMPQYNKNVEMNASDENAAMCLGRAVVAYPEQDQLAHLESHMAFALDPVLGSNPLLSPTFIPAVLEHVKQHMVLWYTQRVEYYAGERVGELKPKYSKKTDMSTIDKAVASASHMVTNDTKAGFAQFMPVLQQLQQMAAQIADSQKKAAIPPDPQADAYIQTGMAETQRKAEKDKADTLMDMKKLEAQVQEASDKNQLTAAMATEKNLTEERMATLDLTVEAAKIKREQEQTVMDLQNQLQDTITEQQLNERDLADKMSNLTGEQNAQQEPQGRVQPEGGVNQPA
jgi:hypothetical protein